MNKRNMKTKKKLLFLLYYNFLCMYLQKNKIVFTLNVIYNILCFFCFFLFVRVLFKNLKTHLMPLWTLFFSFFVYNAGRKSYKTTKSWKIIENFLRWFIFGQFAFFSSSSFTGFILYTMNKCQCYVFRCCSYFNYVLFCF